MTSKSEWWEEQPVFYLPGVESRGIPALVKPCTVLIHGIDGKTNPQLLDTDELLQVVDQDSKLTFTYDRARVVGETASEETILQVATELLEFLRGNAGHVRDEDADPPSFMFFAYDLGGTILKQALVQASLNDQFRWIFDQTSLVIFYGTPHRSVNSQAWALNALRLLHLAFNGLLDSWICGYVERMSQYHQKLNGSFRELGPHFRILNVCQKTGSSTYDSIVDASCATVGLETEVLVSLERSHYQLGILLGYQQRQWMKEILLNENIRHWGFYHKFLAVVQTNQQKDWCLLKEDTQSSTGIPAFFLDENAKKWRDTSDTDIVRLIPPHDMRFHNFFRAFSNHIQTTNEGNMDIFLRLECGPAHGTVSTQQQIYISMCLQLLKQRPSLIMWIRYMYPNLRDAILGLDDRWKTRALSRCLRTLLLAPKPGTTFCLVDVASEGPQKEIISQILALTQQSEIPFRLLVSTPSGLTTGLEVLDGSPCVDLYHNPLAATAAETCLKSAREGRSFELWARMLGNTEHFDDPHFDMKADSLEKGLVSLSNSDQLSITLGQILSRCVRNGMTWMLRALAFVCFAVRPLSRLEMQQVLEIVSSQESSVPIEDRNGEILLQALDLALPSLLTITDDAVWGRPQLRQILGCLWTGHSGYQDDPELYIARVCFRMVANRFQSYSSMDGDSSEPVDKPKIDAEFIAKSPRCEALHQYAARYWMEHHLRGIRDVSHFSETFQDTLNSNHHFDQDAWIQYLASLHWSSGLEWLADKILPGSIQNFMEIDPASASCVSFRMATLPLTTGDDVDWLFLQVIRNYLSEEASFEIVFKQKALFDICRQSTTLQKFVATTPGTFRDQFLKDYDNGDFFQENFANILSTAIAIGNVNTTMWLLDMVPTYRLGRKNENTVETTLVTALQVASEYGDEHVVEKILGLKVDLDPVALHKEFPWNSLYAACHQGQSSIVSSLIGKIGNDQQSSASCICSTSSMCPLLITSARGLFTISKTLAPLHSGAHANEELSKSAVGLVTTHGYLKTLESLLDDHHFRIALKCADKHPLFSAIESGNHEMASKVYVQYLDAVYEEYDNQNRSCEEGDESSESSESEDAEDSILHDAEKIIEQALFTAIDCNMAQFSARHIMENLRNPSMATDSQGQTPLIISAIIGSVEFAEQLKLNDDDAGGDHMRKALCLASKHGHLDFVNYLSQKVPSLFLHDSSKSWTTYNQPSTPVTSAAAGGYHGIVKELVDRMSTEDLKTEFLEAAKYGLDRAMETILSVATLRDPRIREGCIEAMDEDSNTALHHATRGKHPRVVRFMINQGASLEIANNSEMTPLVIASLMSSLDSMKLLLEAGASTETLINGGRSVLMQTIWWDNQEAVDLLLQYNARACKAGYWSNGTSSLLEFTVYWSTDNVLRSLLKHFAKIRKIPPPESIPEEIPTPTEALRIVIKHGNASSADVLFDIWKEFDDTLQEDDFEIGSVFMYAARFGTMDMLQRIWEQVKASIDVNEIKGFHGSALQAATSSEVDTLPKFNALIDWGAKLVPEINGTIAPRTFIPSGSSRVHNYESLHGYMGTPLHVAAFSAKRDLIEAILHKQNDLKDWPDRMGRLPLHFAAEKGDLETLYQLVSESSPIHAEDIQQRNVLHIACAVGNISLVDEFVDKEFASSFINKPDVDGWTPLHWACRSGNDALVKILIAKGADVSKAATRPAGWLPYDVAIFHGWTPESLCDPEIRSSFGDEVDGTSSVAGTYAGTEYSCSRMTDADEKPRESGEVSNSNCDCCHCAIFGRRHQCNSTDAICARFDLCFKCVGHAADIHFMDHEFVERDPY